jgi:hypothetical protein
VFATAGAKRRPFCIRRGRLDEDGVKGRKVLECVALRPV